MTGIGFNLGADADPNADIEETLVATSEAGMVDGDFRVLALLTVWLGVHHAHVNAARLERILLSHGSARVRCFWAAIGRWLARDRRLHRLVALHDAEPLPLLEVGNDFAIERRGEDSRFLGTALRVPLGALRDRASDVLSPEALVGRHPGYRHRVLMGPSWRAQVWTVLERDADLPIAEAARQAGCAFATAWEVAQDHRLLRRAGGGQAETV